MFKSIPSSVIGILTIFKLKSLKILIAKKYVGSSTNITSPVFVKILHNNDNACVTPFVVNNSFGFTILQYSSDKNLAKDFLNSIYPGISPYCNNDGSSICNTSFIPSLIISNGNNSVDGCPTPKLTISLKCGTLYCPY